MPTNPALDLGKLRSDLEKSGAPWQMAYTSMTALTEEERVVRLGVPLPPNPDELEKAGQAAAAAAQGISGIGTPASFDLRNVNGSNYSTPVEDQGGCGSCVAFGVVATLEGVTRYTRGTPNLPVDFSEAHLFYCYGKAAGASCGSGWLPEPALDAAKNSGIAFADYFPYTAGDQACAVNADWPNHRVKVTDWQSTTSNVALMKYDISTYGSITACFFVYQDFASYGGGVYKHVSGALAGGHCVCLVGYDDSQGCWIAKNSWGTGWGEGGGYFRIGYGECAIETWHTCGVLGTTLRTWWPNQQVVGLWSNEADANIWAYAATRGWLKLDGVAVSTAQGILEELAAAKAGGRAVGVFEDGGVLQQAYVW
jgi:C1A family cysteine protease